MNNSENNFDRIEAYLLQLMSASERQAFELELQESPELSQQLKLQKAEHLAMDMMLQADLRQALREMPMGDNIETKPVLRKTFSAKSMMRWAAAAVLILAVGIWYLLPGSGDPYAAFEGASVYRSGSNVLPQVLQPAASAMQAGRYREALSILEQTQDSTWAEDIRLMRGECHFNLRELPAAETLLREIVSNPQGVTNQQRAEYDLMLVLWAKGDQQAARALHHKISNQTGHRFKTAAEKLKL